MHDPAPRYDVFLSYAWEDIELAELMQALLEERGLSVFRDVTGMRDYDDIPVTIRAALDGARTLVALYTPSFPESQYCRWELYTALTRSHLLSGGTRRVMAVVRGMEFSQVLSSRLKCLRLPATSAAPDEVAESVAAVVGEFDSRRFGDAPPPPEPDWYPRPAVGTADFTGRLRELWAVRDALDGDDGAGSATPPVVTVVGPGGIGKTMLAEEYARLFAADHPGGVVRLSGLGSHGDSGGDPARVRALVDEQLARIAVRLKLVGQGEPSEAASTALGRYLAGRGLPYLWILDDLPKGVDTETFRSLVAPTALGRTLVTSRYRSPGEQGASVELRELDALDAAAVLAARRPITPGRERQSAKRLASDLGHHPLALAVAAQLVALPGTGGFTGLREALGTPGPDALELAPRLGLTLSTDHTLSIAATLLRGADRLGPDGRTVLRLAALLAPAPVSERLLAQIVARAERCDEAAAAHRVAEALRRARELALTRQAGDEAWSVHVLVSRAVTAADLDDGARRQLREAAVGVLTARLEHARDTASPTGTEEVLPHVRAVTAALTNEAERHLLNEAGRAHIASGHTFLALDAYRDLYDACRGSLGDDDVTTLIALTGLGIAHGLCGDLEQSRACKQSAYQGLARALGARHPDTVTALNNLGVAHLDLEDYAQARRVFAEVHRIRCREHGVHHPETVQALSNIAVTASRQGLHRLAERLRTTALERTRRSVGSRHPQYADELNNMGVTALALGRADARDWFRQAHRLREEMLGPDHPETLDALENLLTTDWTQALDPSGSSTVADRLTGVYWTRVRHQGPGHPDTLRTVRHCLIARQHALPPTGSAAPPAARPVEVLPAGLTAGGVRLDAHDMDLRVETFELACAVHETSAPDPLEGDEQVRALVVQCWLAHATAAMDQLDAQFDAALAIAEDAEILLVQELGRDHETAVGASTLRGWLEQLVDDAWPDGASSD
ncbi:toll/interleukin-1 receptor domain-containing protein [Streptomyces sp. NPDC006617]|uniref:tetratricopeptide repeat protein n=1 Tax=Streptomyces sp. NPDC006617 TaxID=3155354 RepID=UPI0033BE87D4